MDERWIVGWRHTIRECVQVDPGSDPGRVFIKGMMSYYSFIINDHDLNGFRMDKMRSPSDTATP